MMLTCTTVCVRLCFMYESKHLNVNSCTVWTQWKSTQFYSKFFVWLTSSSSLSASSCHRSCRVRRGEGEGGSGEAGRDVMFQLDYRHLYIWYNNIISIVGNIGFTCFITSSLYTLSQLPALPLSLSPLPSTLPTSLLPTQAPSPCLFSSVPPPVGPSFHSWHVLSPYLLSPCCSTLKDYPPNNRSSKCFWAKVLVSSTHACFCAKKSLYQTRGSHLCVNFWSVCNWSGAQRRSPGSRVST